MKREAASTKRARDCRENAVDAGGKRVDVVIDKQSNRKLSAHMRRTGENLRESIQCAIAALPEGK